MRIIAGQFRGRNLKSPPSLAVRPTSDRLRETLFNVIAPRIQGARFLDLCAGSGAVGIEAISRGATQVTFVDNSRAMCALIKSNLDLCGIGRRQSEVIQSNADDYLRRIAAAREESEKPRDLIFFDPPYETNYLPVLDTLGAHADRLLRKNGLLIVEHHYKNDLKAQLGSIIRSRILKQGDSSLSFYELSQTPRDPRRTNTKTTLM